MKNIFLIFITIILFSSCYSFKGISISPEIQTYNIPFVEIRTGDAPTGVNLTFQDLMIQKISRESRLDLDADNPDVSLKCTITKYAIEATSPTSDNNLIKVGWSLMLQWNMKMLWTRRKIGKDI